MEKRRLGNSEIRVSPIGLGCWQFSKGVGLAGGYWPALPDEQIRDIVSASLEGGITFFDTAEAYGRGASERALAGALSALGVSPDQVVVATKWMPFFRCARSISRTISARTDALRPFPIDLHQIHHPLSLSSIAKQMREMSELVSRGIVRTVGVSNFSAAQMREAHRALSEYGISLVSNQVNYSLLNRRIERNGVLETAAELGITIIAYSPLAQGLLTGKFHRDPSPAKKLRGPRRLFRRFRNPEATAPLIELLEELAGTYEATPAQIALNWLISCDTASVVAIPGASSARQAESNAAALGFALTPDDRETLSHRADLIEM